MENNGKQVEKPNPKATSDTELKKSTQHIIVEIIEYAPDSIVSKTIIKKTGGNVTASSFDEGEELCERTIPSDTYVQIIDGAADLTIGKEVHHMELGSGIVIPANTSHCFNANEQFKMISTIIKTADGE